MTNGNVISQLPEKGFPFFKCMIPVGNIWAYPASSLLYLLWDGDSPIPGRFAYNNRTAGPGVE